jgi:cytochrome c oxidase subunit 3
MNETGREITGTHAPSLEAHRDYAGSKLGMWLFLFSECMLFGGLFTLYAMYRGDFTQAFLQGGREMDVLLGVINTLILLTGSMTIAMSLTALQKNHTRLAIGLIVTTILLALIFMINKGIEWNHHFQEGLYPSSDVLKGKEGEQIFFAMYYLMTGLHGLHVIAAGIVLTVMLVLVIRGKVTARDSVKLENSALYWHLVDIIWILLLPLFYLAA